MIKIKDFFCGIRRRQLKNATLKRFEEWSARGYWKATKITNQYRLLNGRERKQGVSSQ